MTIVVASGKGGTGKTTVALGLAHAAPGEVILLDCDVEAPNAHLFFHDGNVRRTERYAVPVPRVDGSLCTGCGACARFCAYGALAVVNRRVIVIDELCHSCGGCRIVCPEGAITEAMREIGTVVTERHGPLTLITGDLDVGQTLAPPLIREVKARGRASAATAGVAEAGRGVAGPATVIIDAPPGATCPVVESARGADVGLLVTENTPFGIHDLELAATLLADLGVPAGVVINRAGIGFSDESRIRAVCGRHGLPILLRIPYSAQVAVAYARGTDILSADISLRRGFEELLEQLRRLAGDGVCA